MKKLFFTLCFAFLFTTASVKAQITLEHTYPGPSGPPQSRPIVINMGGTDGYKYMYTDYLTNQIKLFNLNHTPYSTVNVPIPLIDEGEYTIGYVTRSLFDCDSTMFEYAILPGNWRNNFYIYRQNNSLLFQSDSTVAPYCFGCFSGSNDVRPIYNTPEGAKLFLYPADSLGNFRYTEIYSLCGTLPTNAEVIDASSSLHIKVFPNPTAMEINFEISPPNNFEKFELVIFDITGNEQKRESIRTGNNKITLDISTLSNGTYIYSLVSKGKTQESGKFIITK